MRSSNFKRKQRDKAFSEWAADVLANPGNYTPLRVARVNADLTQAELAKRSSLSPSSVALIESRGKSKGNPHSRERLASALDLDEKELFPYD